MLFNLVVNWCTLIVGLGDIENDMILRKKAYIILGYFYYNRQSTASADTNTDWCSFLYYNINMETFTGLNIHGFGPTKF